MRWVGSRRCWKARSVDGTQKPARSEAGGGGGNPGRGETEARCGRAAAHRALPEAVDDELEKGEGLGGKGFAANETEGKLEGLFVTGAPLVDMLAIRRLLRRNEPLEFDEGRRFRMVLGIKVSLDRTAINALLARGQPQRLVTINEEAQSAEDECSKDDS